MGVINSTNHGDIMITITYDALIAFILFLVCFGIGYILGKLNSSVGGVLYDDNNFIQNKKVIKNNIAQQKPLIKIDDTKFVTDIDTKTMEKKFDSLGDVKVSSDSVDNSVSKLKNMKG